MDNTVGESAEKINIRGELRYREPMSRHTTLRIGGPADIYAVPADRDDLGVLIAFASETGLPLQIIGGGANILVADAGIRGLVVDLSSLCTVARRGDSLVAEAGASISSVSERAALERLSGLEFIYAMPGSTGGAIWMNARCYGRSISEVLEWVEYADGDGNPGRLDMPHSGFSYKRSPFQGSDRTVYRASFALSTGNEGEIRTEMNRVYADRKAKGHFDYPSAGSVFKNDRSLGKPTGVLLDELGLKGSRIGNAQIAPYHANIIINLGGASAIDVYRLVQKAREEARRRLHVELEPEIQFIGEWGGVS